MSEIINNLDIATRLALLSEDLPSGSPELKLINDALAEIERLRAENKKLKYLAKL